MGLDTTAPFRGSDAMRSGELTWGVLRGPGFRRLETDTYVAADVPDSPLLSVWAALVRAGPDAAATGWSACLALGLDCEPRPMPVEIATSGRRRHPARPASTRRQRLADDEIVVIDGVRTTTALRTAFDLARRCGPDRRAVDAVIEPLTDAVVAADALACHGEFTAGDLSSFATRHPGLRGVRRVPRVVALLDPRPDSPPESRMRVKVVLAGLPRPVVRLELDGGRRELDLAWPRFRVALEYDGHDHALADRRGRDIDRLDELRSRGWIVIVVTALQLARPHWVAERARRALISQGWTPGPNLWQPVLDENAAWYR